MSENTSHNKSRSSLQIEFERRILHGLMAEWKQASFRLNESLRKAFNPPAFLLSDMKGKWGYWSLENREICLSRDLVQNYSWGTVREILHHEMAHQLAQEILGGQFEKPHGPAFQRACVVLRANPKASGNYPTLEDRIHAEISSDEDRLLVRIQKLMALAESSNQHEAELAMTKANELMTRFNIDSIQNNTKKSYESIFVGKPALRQSRDMRFLSILLNKYYYVECIWVPAYVVEKDKMGRVLELSGTPQNIQIAEYVYYFVRNFIDAQWQDYKKEKKLSHHRRVDFAEGIIKGFQYKLKRQHRRLKRKSAPEEQALINVSDPGLTEYLQFRYPHVRTHRASASNVNLSVVNDGRRVGQKLVISKGITRQENGTQPLMIEN
jgi:hypothetical protein